MADSKSALERARQAALQGKTEEAMAALRTYADSGDASASASLAELLAFYGEWEECLQRAGEYISRPQSVYIGNVFDDMIALLARCGRETQLWGQIRHVTHVAVDCIEENVADYPSPKQAAVRWRHGRYFEALDEYAAMKGLIKQDFKHLFVPSNEPTQAEDALAYQSAVRDALKLRKRPEALSRHCFFLARSYGQDAEGIRLYEEGRMPPHFEYALFAAQAYVRQGSAELAWDVVRKHVGQWWPLDPAQVAPVILLTDPDLAGLLTVERCEQVIAQPRGPEAPKSA